MVANSQVFQSRSPVNIAQQRLLDGQRAVWDYLIGEDSWTEEDLTIPLDAEVIHSGDWVIGTS
ncbi:MAG TPA: hypothetical protein ENK11_01140, partial [Phycisphaerales bacterium]|nr:hypothetical protein [Phycisphaerales bacterium]